MKKLLLTALAGIALLSTSFAAGTNTVNNKIKHNFGYDFKNVQDVKWSARDSYVVASFNLNDKGTQAFYDFDGSLIGTAQAVAVDNLPLSAKRTLAKKYSNYVVSETISFEKNDEVTYFISLSNNKESVVLQVKDGQVSFYKKLS